MKKGGFVRDALILFLITLVSGAALGGVYSVTKEPIAAQNAKAKADAWNAVMPDAASYDETVVDASTLEAANAEIAGMSFGSVTVDEAVAAKDGSDAAIGCVVTATSNDGFGGAVTVSVGILSDGTVQGIAFPSGLSETAGLGMKAQEEPFYSQYAGKNVDEFSVTKDAPANDGDIQAISGATITSKAVTGAVNAAVYFAGKYMAQ